MNKMSKNILLWGFLSLLGACQQPIPNHELQEKQKLSQAYLAKNKQRPEVITTSSGLQYEILKAGTGERPQESDKIEVHYRGTFTDGTEFDSSHKTGQPIQFQLNQVIPGWTEGVQLMRPGAKYKFTIPYDLAYGPRGNRVIPPYAVLLFEIELLAIK